MHTELETLDEELVGKTTDWGTSCDCMAEMGNESIALVDEGDDAGIEVLEGESQGRDVVWRESLGLGLSRSRGCRCCWGCEGFARWDGCGCCRSGRVATLLVDSAPAPVVVAVGGAAVAKGTEDGGTLHVALESTLTMRGMYISLVCMYGT
jgi:hypothetical protein